MYVCICNAVTDKAIQSAIDAGATDLWDLQRELGVGSGCGCCKEMASGMLRANRQVARKRSRAEPTLYQPTGVAG